MDYIYPQANATAPSSSWHPGATNTDRSRSTCQKQHNQQQHSHNATAYRSMTETYSAPTYPPARTINQSCTHSYKHKNEKHKLQSRLRNIMARLLSQKPPRETAKHTKQRLNSQKQTPNLPIAKQSSGESWVSKRLAAQPAGSVQSLDGHRIERRHAALMQAMPGAMMRSAGSQSISGMSTGTVTAMATATAPGLGPDVVRNGIGDLASASRPVYINKPLPRVPRRAVPIASGVESRAGLMGASALHLPTAMKRASARGVRATGTVQRQSQNWAKEQDVLQVRSGAIPQLVTTCRTEIRREASVSRSDGLVEKSASQIRPTGYILPVRGLSQHTVPSTDPSLHYVRHIPHPSHTTTSHHTETQVIEDRIIDISAPRPDSHIAFPPPKFISTKFSFDEVGESGNQKSTTARIARASKIAGAKKADREGCRGGRQGGRGGGVSRAVDVMSRVDEVDGEAVLASSSRDGRIPLTESTPAGRMSSGGRHGTRPTTPVRLGDALLLTPPPSGLRVGGVVSCGSNMGVKLHLSPKEPHPPFIDLAKQKQDHTSSQISPRTVSCTPQQKIILKVPISGSVMDESNKELAEGRRTLARSENSFSACRPQAVPRKTICPTPDAATTNIVRPQHKSRIPLAIATHNVSSSQMSCRLDASHNDASHPHRPTFSPHLNITDQIGLTNIRSRHVQRPTTKQLRNEKATQQTHIRETNLPRASTCNGSGAVLSSYLVGSMGRKMRIPVRIGSLC